MSLIQTVTTFSVVIDGKAQNFATEQEARIALAREQFKGRAEAYTQSLGLDGKQAVAKQNCIADFLAYEAVQAETASAE